MSYTRCESDIAAVRELIEGRGDHLRIFAKIENFEGVSNYEEILQQADGIIINRHNLSLEYPSHKVFLLLKYLTERAIAETKPIYMYGNVLDSMVHSDTPLYYEVADVVDFV